MMIYIKSTWRSLVFLFVLLVLPLHAQKLEPRLLTNVPVRANFVLAGYGYSAGNTLLDPAVPIDDLNSSLHTFFAAYVRTISVFGLAGKIDAILPYASGDWGGTFMGVDTTTARDGFGDPLFRLSVNFVGAPALRPQDFKDYDQKTIVGASIQVSAPFGQYFPERLINLGSNRWMIRPQLGLSHHTGKWFLETYVSAWFFTKNPDFWGGNTIEQKPLVTTKVHVIRSLPRGMWVEAGVAYGIGGRSYINSVKKDTRISTFLFGGTFAMPLKPRHSLKLTVTSSARIERGPDINAIALTYQYLWW